MTDTYFLQTADINGRFPHEPGYISPTPPTITTPPASSKKMFFSMTSGQIYEVFEDEVKNLDEFQVPLIARPNPSCKKCHGRLYWGFNKTMEVYELCHRCLRKCVDFKDEDKKEIRINAPIKQQDNSALPIGTHPA